MNKLKTHFDDDAWIRFVRGLVDDEEASAMRAHLEEGCTDCRQAHDAWQRCEEMVRQEPHEITPASAIRLVKAAFALRRKIPFPPGLAHAAELIFDSFREPQPMGVRGGPASSRQVLYEAGAFLVDLRFERNFGPEGAITGQVVSSQPDRPAGGAAVALVETPGVVVGQTIANSLGEFQFDCAGQGEFKVCLQMPDGTLIEAALPEGETNEPGYPDSY